MTVRSRLMIVTIMGLAVTMAIWGWIQLRALDKILLEQQLKKLYDVSETVSTYYQHFPTLKGLSALDSTLKDHVQSDTRLARIDIFSVSRGNVDYIAGAGRIPYEWSDASVGAVVEKSLPRHLKLVTEGGPAIGLLYPAERVERQGLVVVATILFSRSSTEILSRAQQLLILSSGGLLLVILLILAFSYGWIIGRPLEIIIDTIDEFQTGQHIKRIPLDRSDEWGQLADHFNLMADEIESFLGRNRELTRQLEDRVQEATHKVVQLQQQVNQLQQLTALGYLTATLAHDLGTPLHSIAGLANLILETDGIPQDVNRKLELIVQQTQRLNTVIQNVRRATRLPGPHFEAISVTDLLNETLPLVEPLLQKSGIRLVVNVEPDIPVLYVDRYRIQTALFNLIQNAIEAMDGKGEVIVSAGAMPDRHLITVTVEDNGPGIPPELMERVCEPFFSTHTDEGLRGLGLAIVQDIVKAHGGHMGIISRPREGTEITLYFPLVDAAPGERGLENKSSLTNP